MKTHPLDVVDAAYDLKSPYPDWLERLCELIGEMSGEEGVFAYDFTLENNVVMLDTIVGEGVGPMVRTMAGNSTPPIVHHFYRHPPSCGTFADAIELFQLPQLEPIGRGMFRELGGFEDLFLITAKGLDGKSLHLNVPKSVWSGPSSQATKDRWSRISAHVSAGLRLRQLLTEPHEDDAVLDAEGSLLHASGEQVTSAREALREAVVARERARSSMRHREPETALETWRGLVEGTWSLVDHIDHDGRRFVVARKNPPEVRDPRALTSRERQVADLLARGLSTKVLAYALGLSIGSISNHVSAIQRKLRANNRAHLIAILRAIPQAALS